MLDENFRPYLEYALKLSIIKRKGLGNMFRHQMETFAILLEYGYTDSVLLKASLIHDFIEDAQKINFINTEQIKALDYNGNDVFMLVNEVSIKSNKGKEESKKDFLLRIMNHGSEQAKILKLADRLSNITSLFYVEDTEFVRRYLNETRNYILPYAFYINQKMATELQNIINIHTRKHLKT